MKSTGLHGDWTLWRVVAAGRSPSGAPRAARGRKPQPSTAATCPPSRGQVRPAVAQERQLRASRPLPTSGCSLCQGGRGFAKPGRGRRLVAAGEHSRRAGLGEDDYWLRRLQGQGAAAVQKRLCGGPGGARVRVGPPTQWGSDKTLGSPWGTLWSLPGYRPGTWADIHGRSHQARFGGAAVGWAWGRELPQQCPDSEGHKYLALFWEPLVQDVILPPQVSTASSTTSIAPWDPALT